MGEIVFPKNHSVKFDVIFRDFRFRKYRKIDVRNMASVSFKKLIIVSIFELLISCCLILKNCLPYPHKQMPLFIRTPGDTLWMHYGHFSAKNRCKITVFSDKMFSKMTIVRSIKILKINKTASFYLLGYGGYQHEDRIFQRGG